MNPDLKTIQNTGFYFYPDTHSCVQDKSDSAFIAYFNSTRRRLFSPGIASEAFVVRYYGFKGMYNDVEYLASQYVYYSIYDAMRQVLSYKQDESEGRIELLAYTDSTGLELFRAWDFEVEGFVNMDGDNEIEYAGWAKVK